MHRAVTTTPADVERALRHAERSYGFERWDDAASEERAEVIERAADIVESRVADIAYTDALTSGVPIAKARLVAQFLPHRIRAAAADLRTLPRRTALDAAWA